MSKKLALITSNPPGEEIDLFHQFDFFHKSLWYTFFVDSERRLRIHSKRSNTWDKQTPLYKKKLKEVLMLDEYYDLIIKNTLNKEKSPQHIHNIKRLVEQCFWEMDRFAIDMDSVLQLNIHDILAKHLHGVSFWSSHKDKHFEVKDTDLKSTYWTKPRLGYRVYRNGKRTKTFVPPKKPIKIDTFVENVLAQAATNGLHEHGFCTPESAESDIDIAKRLKDEVQYFIQHYSSLSDYYKYKRELLRDKRQNLLSYELSLYETLGFQFDLSYLSDYLEKVDVEFDPYATAELPFPQEEDLPF